MTLSTTFQLYREGQFYWIGKKKKKVLHQRYHIIKSFTH